jgi:hypothetical protein
MQNQTRKEQLSVVTKPTFRQLLSATFFLVRLRVWPVIAQVLFALFGLFLLTTPLTTKDRLGPIEILLAVFCFSILPLATVLGAWGAHRQGKLIKGPFTYNFDVEGMHVSGGGFTQTIQWLAIPRVHRTKCFLFVFISRARAHYIPIKDVTDPDFFERLQMVAAESTEFD